MEYPENAAQPRAEAPVPFPSPFVNNEDVDPLTQLARGMATGKVIKRFNGKQGLIEIDGFRYEYLDQRKRDARIKQPFSKLEGQVIAFTFWPTYDAEQAQARDPFDPPTLKIASQRKTMPAPGLVEVVGVVSEVGDGYVTLAINGNRADKGFFIALLGDYDGPTGALIQTHARLAEGAIQLERWQVLRPAEEPEESPAAVAVEHDIVTDSNSLPAELAASPGDGALSLAELEGRARAYALNAKASNTLRAYRADWRKFTAWCEARGLQALPAAPETVAMFAAELAGGEKSATLQRRMSAISQAHRAAGHESPTRAGVVQNVLAGVRRAHGSAQVGKAALLTEDIRAMVAAAGEDLAGHRDRALVLLGFAGAFRRSELVALQVEDLAFTSSGLVVTMRRSKMDQEGQGAKKGIPFGASERTCPVHAVRKWIEAARLSSGPVFRGVTRWGQVQTTPLSDRAVALIVKKLATAAGLNSERYAGHSLRAGLATQAAMNGVEERVIQSQTGHKSVTVLRRYIRDGSLFRQNAASSLGL